MSAPTPQRVHERDHRRPEIAMSDCWDCRKGWETCRRKRTFSTAEEARSSAHDLNVLNDWERPLASYRCCYCTLWHHATAKTKIRKKRVERERRKWLASTVTHNRPAVGK